MDYLILDFYKTLVDAFQTTRQPSLKSVETASLGQILASHLTHQAVDRGLIGDATFRSLLQRAVKEIDFRILGKLVATAFAEGTAEAVRLLEWIVIAPEEAYTRIVETTFGPPKVTRAPELLEFVSLDRVLADAPRTKATEVCIFNSLGEEALQQIILRANGEVVRYLESSLDLLGFNCLVRKGLVKLVPLYRSRLAVAKRTNPDKPGRLRLDIESALRIAQTIGGEDEQPLLLTKGEALEHGATYLRIVRPFAVVRDRANGELYSMTNYWEGPTLEEVLLATPEGPERRRHLRCVRIILELLYEHGIVWGDLAPRNIIVSQIKDGELCYCLLDFEKTTFCEAPVPLEKRLEHARGPMCVEEFGSVCTLPEVVETFIGYFDPNKWDTVSNASILLTKPKREIIDIITHKSGYVLDWGTYNRTELEVLKARFPIKNLGEEWIRPLFTSFMVDHLVGAEADRKTTELFAEAANSGSLAECVVAISSAVEAIENDLIISDLAKSLDDLNFTANPSREHTPSFRLLSKSIDLLHEKRGTLELSDAVHRIRRESAFFRIWQSSTESVPQTRAYSDELRDDAFAILAECGQRGLADLIAVSGSLVRSECTYGSDVEVFLIGNLWSEAERWLQNRFSERLGIDIDMYAVTSIGEIPTFLGELPDYFIDFQNAKLAYGSDRQWNTFQRTVSGVAQRDGFLRAVLSKRTSEAIEAKWLEGDLDAGTLKAILNLWASLEAICNRIDLQSPLANSVAIKERLLYHKSRFEFESRWGQETALVHTLTKDALLALELLKKSYNFIEQALSISPYVKPEIVLNERTSVYLSEHSTFNKVGGGIPSLAEEKITEDLTAWIISVLPASLQPEIPRTIDRGDGVFYSLDGDGCDGIDLSAMTVNCILGQNDPWVCLCQAIYAMSKAPSFIPSRFLSSPYIHALAEFRMSGIAGIKEPVISSRQCNGSDAVEIALKAAFHLRGERLKLVSFKGSYHGQNLTCYFASDAQSQHRFLTDPPEVFWLPAPSHRKTWRVTKFLEERDLDAHERNIVESFRRVASESYAIILEPIQCNNGLKMFSQPLMRALRCIAAEHNVCFIVDEIQTGCGWMGKLTACEVYGVVPDAICLSKALTAGYASAAMTVWNGRKWDVLPYGSAEKTNGGNPLAYVAMRAVHERLFGTTRVPSGLFNKTFEDELTIGLVAGISKPVKMIESYFHELLCDFPDIINCAMGFGLLRGLKLKDQKVLSAVHLAKDIASEALKQRVLVRASYDAIMVKPPIITSMEELFEGFRRLHKAIEIVAARSAPRRIMG